MRSLNNPQRKFMGDTGCYSVERPWVQIVCPRPKGRHPVAGQQEMWERVAEVGYCLSKRG
jgi:hypothetical protein